MEKKSHQPSFPKVLIGRTPLLTIFDTAYYRAASGSASLFVSGYAGSGKSALVHEAGRRILSKGGLFVYGKYDQYRNDPYHALKDALRQLASAVLMFDEREYHACLGELTQALGPYGGILSAFAPEWKRISTVDKDAEIEDLTLREQRSILVSLITSVISVLTSPSRPLVLFLDDLQWIDEGSAQLLSELLGLKRPDCFLFIGAYRVEELDRANPVWNLIFKGEEQREEHTHIVNVPPLEHAHVKVLLEEMFPRSIMKMERFTALITHISGGNPLRLRELIIDLLGEGVLHEGEGKEYRWVWKEEALRERYPESSGRFYLQRVDSIGTELKNFLITISAAGGEFSPSYAAAATDRSEENVVELLNAGTKEGFLVPSGEKYYRFTHDIIRETFYTFVPPEGRSGLHLTIAERFEKAYPQSAGERIFALAYHYNRAADLLKSEEDVRKLITLNLNASETAFKQTAWEKSFEYAKTAIELLPNEYWSSDYSLALDVMNIGTEAAFLSGHHDAIEKWANIVERFGKSNLDKSRIWKIRVQSLVAKRFLSDALEAALRYSARMGKRIFVHPLFKWLNWNPIRRRRLYNLALNLADGNRKRRADPNARAYVEILSVALGSAYLLNQDAFAQITFAILRASLIKGAGGSEAFAYVCFGFVLVMMKQYTPAISLAEIGLRISSRSLSPAENAKVYMFHGILVEHWKSHLSRSVKVLEKGSTAGTLSGEYEYASFSLSVMCFYSILEAREKLSNVQEKMEESLIRVIHMKQNRNIAVLRSNRQWLKALRGLTPDYDTLSGDGYDEAGHVERTRKTGDKSHLATYYTGKLFSAVLFNDYRKAEGYARGVEDIIHHIAGQAHYPLYFYLYGFTCLKLSWEEKGPGKVLKRLNLAVRAGKNIRKVTLFAKAVPVNHIHRLHLLRAEKYRNRGRFKKALKLFTLAAKAAEKNGSLYDRGLIAEHTAFFFRDFGVYTSCREYIHRARRFYAEWEAKAKVKQLEELYPDLLESKGYDDDLSPSEEGPSFHDGAEETLTPGVEELIGTSLAVSRERYIGGLLNRFMQTVMKISKAGKGILFEKNGNSFLPRIMGERDVAGEGVKVKEIFDTDGQYSMGILNYTLRVGETLVYKAEEIDRFASDPYIVSFRPHGIISIPIAIYREIKSCLYLEYTEAAPVPSEGELDLIHSLAVQAVLSMDREYLLERERELLEQNREQLLKTMQAEKLASLGFLVAEVAHELDNPNQAILLNAENLKESSGDIIALLDELAMEEDFSLCRLDYRSFREEYRGMINSLGASAKQIDRLAAELRDFVRPKREFGRQAVNVNDVLDSTVLIASHFIKKSTSDFLLSKGEVPLVVGDFQKLQQVFLNCIRNACQAVSATRSKVAVTTGFREKERRVVVSIEDEGPGMDTSILEEIEKPFFSTRHGEKGLGLGLYVSSTIIKQHGGEMVFNSQSGEGTRVQIFLPPGD